MVELLRRLWTKVHVHPGGLQRSRATATVLALAWAVAGCATETQPDAAASNGGAAGASATGSVAGMPNAGSGGTTASHAGAGGASGGSAPLAGASSGLGGTAGGGASAVAGVPGGGFAGMSAGEAGEAGQAGVSSTEDPLEAARAAYHGWQQRTDEPLNISAEIFSLCRSPTAAEQAFVASEHGNELYLLDWVNAEAAAGFDAGATAPFPVGAAIVKEKLTREGADYVLVALGLMVKREAGFDPTHGDWQFGYWQPEDGMASGTSTNRYCGACHATSTTDFVFLDETWRVP